MTPTNLLGSGDLSDLRWSPHAFRVAADLRKREDVLVGLAGGVVFFRDNPTESYVSMPPAYNITDENGATWTFGSEYNTNWEWSVLCDDVSTGEFAQFVEYRRGRIILLGSAGRRIISRNRRHII